MTSRVLVMEFAAHFHQVDMARAALQGICDECFGTERERAADITMAANEAMNNAVEHAGTATVRLEVTWDADQLRIVVINDGPPFDPVAAAAALDEATMLERDEGGYGLYLIRELVDRLDYEYRDSRNRWILCKLINPNRAEGDPAHGVQNRDGR